MLSSITCAGRLSHSGMSLTMLPIGRLCTRRIDTKSAVRIGQRPHSSGQPYRQSLRHLSVESEGQRQLRRSTRLKLGKHIQEALANGSPIVALESTVITHGLPEPQNLQLALDLERIVAGNELERGKSVGVSRQDESLACAVVPATVGIVKGQLIVGLSAEEIEYLATRRLSKPIKASRRDVPIAMALEQSAGTTVSATMAIASSVRGRPHWAGSSASGTSPIKVFATGGLGGVHIGGEHSMDISADLYEFTRSPIGVVSSGFKSFLDTRRSLEFLESMGATVMSLRPQKLDESDESEPLSNLFPGFFTTYNWQKVESPLVVEEIEQAARILFHCLEANPLADKRACLLACPIPSRFGLSPKLVDEILSSCAGPIDLRPDLAGKDKTPLILEQLNRATEGKSLEANMELLRNNARLGAKLALEYAKLSNRTGAIVGPRKLGQDPFSAQEQPWPALEDYPKFSGSSLAPSKCSSRRQANGSPVVVGCTMIDMHVSTKIDDQFKANANHSGITFEGRPHLSVGGVGRNLAAALEFLGHSPTFITALAKGDRLARLALDDFSQCGLANDQLSISWYESASSNGLPEMNMANSCCFALVLLDSISGQCEYVIANLDAVRALDKRSIGTNLSRISQAPLVVLDANLSDETFAELIRACAHLKVPVFAEPTDALAVPRLVSNLRQLTAQNVAGSLLCLSPNLLELTEMVDQFEPSEQTKSQKWSKNKFEDELEEIKRLTSLLMGKHLTQLKCLLVTMDSRGVLLALRASNEVDDIDQVDLLADWRKDAQIADRSTETRAKIHLKFFPVPERIERPVSGSGAGDSFAAGFISGLLLGCDLASSIQRGFQAAQFALQDRDTISRSLKQLRQLPPPEQHRSN